MDRRRFLASAAATAALAGLPLRPALARAEPPKFALGTVTYNIGAKLDLDTLLRACKASGFAAAELRTTHAHQVEPELAPDARRDVRKKIEDSGVKLWGFGSVCEFHAADPAVVKKNVD